ncbi:MAG: hypothetical protein H7334_11550 [Ferruginibacter sp.]|nr:hypothetical protein [Ferruginibacter sp.]
MKYISLSILSLCLMLSAQSQTIADAKKSIYYGRDESAKKILQTIVSAPPADPDAVYLLGELCLRQGNLYAAYNIYTEKAGAMLQEAYNKKKSPLVYIGWAHVLLDTGRAAEGKALMENILNETKYKNVDALRAIAIVNMDSTTGDLQRAIQLLGLAINRDKKDATLYNLLGDAYRKLHDGSNAVLNYILALQVDPANTEALYKNGKIYKTQNNPDIYMEKFKEAYATDSTYTPVLYELYQYYFSRDVYYAQLYFTKYIEHSDPDPQQAYLAADLDYISKKYTEAIAKAIEVLHTEGGISQPRLYKLIAYSYAALGDSSKAFNYMNQYFDKQDTTGYVAKDFFLQGQLMEKESQDTSHIIATYTKGLSLEKEVANKVDYLNNLIRIASASNNNLQEAYWRGELYTTKPNASNLDLYKWGMALYQGSSYQKADSVFAIYQYKYPDQLYGYLYRAKSNTYLDSAMEKGLAVPYYKKLIEVAEKDEVKNKTVLVMAYEYLAAYEANVTKHYAASLEYFDKLLALDPANADAAKNSKVIKGWMEKEKASK